MPLPLAPLDPALFDRPKATAARAFARRAGTAIGRGIAIQALTAAMLLTRLLAWLLFWPTMIFLLGCAVGVPVFASQGWWWDVAQCVFYGMAALAAYGALARAGGYGRDGIP